MRRCRGFSPALWGGSIGREANRHVERQADARQRSAAERSHSVSWAAAR